MKIKHFEFFWGEKSEKYFHLLLYGLPWYRDTLIPNEWRKKCLFDFSCKFWNSKSIEERGWGVKDQIEDLRFLPRSLDVISQLFPTTNHQLSKKKTQNLKRPGGDGFSALVWCHLTTSDGLFVFFLNFEDGEFYYSHFEGARRLSFERNLPLVWFLPELFRKKYNEINNTLAKQWIIKKPKPTHWW